MISLMRPKGIRPSRNAATATSLAALNTAGEIPPARPAATPAPSARKTSRPHRLERERTRGNRIEAPHPAVGQPRGVGQGVQDRQLHRGKSQLRDHAAVAELGERVDDALRVHHHLERVVRQAEQVVGLDQLERLVGQRGAVHGDLAAHPPGRVAQRLLDRRLPYPLGGPLAERDRPSR